MRVTPADTEPSTKPGSKPPQRARRSSAPSLVYPLRSERARPDGRDHIQLHAVYFQSTFSPLSVHIQSTFSPRTWIHVDPMAFNVERSSGGQGGRGLEAGSGDKAPWRPDGLPGMAGVRDNLQLGIVGGLFIGAVPGKSNLRSVRFGWVAVKASGPGRSGAPAEVLRTSAGTRRPL
jgi:hypothetical protein